MVNESLFRFCTGLAMFLVKPDGGWTLLYYCSRAKNTFSFPLPFQSLSVPNHIKTVFLVWHHMQESTRIHVTLHILFLICFIRWSNFTSSVTLPLDIVMPSSFWPFSNWFKATVQIPFPRRISFFSLSLINQSFLIAWLL